MKTKAIVYWVTTAIIAFELVAGGITDLVRGRTVLIIGPPVVAELANLGYPAYLLDILGIWKLLGYPSLPHAGHRATTTPCETAPHARGSRPTTIG